MTTTITRSLPRLSDGVDESLTHALPEGICRTFRAVAYRSFEGHVLIATADDGAITEHVLRERLEEPIILVPHSPREILAVTDEAYPHLDAVDEDPRARQDRAEMTQILRRGAKVSDEELQRATLEYARTQDPLGDILASHGAISEDDLVAALSEVHQMRRVTLEDFQPDPSIARRLPESLARRLRALPVATDDDAVLLAVARPLSPRALAEVDAALGVPVRQLLAHRGQLDQLIWSTHREQYSQVATSALREAVPERSAHTVLSPPQRVLGVSAALVCSVGVVGWPALTATVLLTLCTVLYVLVSGYRLLLTLRALGAHLEQDIADEDVEALDERRLPVYTILVPLYREARVVARLVGDLDALDYPRTRLEVLLLCEEDDRETIATVHGLDLPPHFHLVVVPDTWPKTKPKACNYGLQLATGTHCVIYDAEDRPDPDQLKKALVAFASTADEVVCIQAKLNHYNQDQNLLTAWFANEYATQFELVLPAMDAADSPIPLGGSSNHFRTRALRELGGWDPYNVTEDADLGIRLHRAGYRTALIDSTTLEEATSTVSSWVRQRSRWVKGHLQTWLVHMRHPVELYRETGMAGFISFNLTMGSVALMLINPIFWTLTALYLSTSWSALETAYPPGVFQVAIALLVVGNFVFVYLNVAGSLQRGQFRLARIALLSPLYWALMSVAAWRGLVQLFTDPFYWEKTEHGLDQD